MVPEYSIFFRSARGQFSLSTFKEFLEAASASPVSIDSSIPRLDACIIRVSAGTLSPVSKWIMSPIVSSLCESNTIFPSRTTFTCTSSLSLDKASKALSDLPS